LIGRVVCRVFSPVKGVRGRPMTVEEIVKRNFVVNNISEKLVF